MKMKAPARLFLAAAVAFALSATAQDDRQPKVESVDLGGRVNLEMVLLPAAKFMMGVKPGARASSQRQPSA